jgi:hypothetical protein
MSISAAFALPRSQHGLLMSKPVENFAGIHADAGNGRKPPSRSVIKFPSRSELDFLNETIPLFYIGQNRDGFWVARDTDGRSGGVFFFKASAVRFARTKTAPGGCALMFLNAPFELDRDNEGSQVVVILTAAIAVARRRVPTFVCFVEMAVAKWRKLLAQLSRAVAGERRHRAAVEHELFHGDCPLASKIDDDVPLL